MHRPAVIDINLIARSRLRIRASGTQRAFVMKYTASERAPCQMSLSQGRAGNSRAIRGRLCAEKHLSGSDQQTLSAVKQMRFDSEMRKAADQ